MKTEQHLFGKILPSKGNIYRYISKCTCGYTALGDTRQLVLEDVESHYQAHSVEGTISLADPNIGKKFDSKKIKYHLIEPVCLEALATVLTFGAEKYGEENWKNLDDFENRYYSALMRHLQAWKKGEKLDDESGLPHLWHAITNLHFLIYKTDELS